MPYNAKSILPSVITRTDEFKVILTFIQAWLAHIEVKEHHFLAVAEYRESMVEYEASRFGIYLESNNVYQQLKHYRRYGVELGRLGKAQSEAKKAYDIARRGKVAASVIHDAQVIQ